MQVKLLFKKLINDEFVKASFFSALSTLIKILTVLLIGKIVANLSGAEGFALFGQLLNFVLIITILTGGCINQGVTKYVSEYNADSKSEKLSKLISTSFRITCYASIFMAILILLFAKTLSRYILYSNNYSIIFTIYGLTLILNSINSLLLSIFNGHKRYKELNIINICLNIAGLFFTLILSYIYNIYGVLFSVILNQSIFFIITMFFLKKEPWLKREFFFLKIDFYQLKLILAFATMGIVSSAITPFASMIIRDNVINNISLASAGIYEFVQRISGSILMFFTTTLSIYFLPRVSEIFDFNVLIREIKKVALISVPIMVILLILVYILRFRIILILGNTDFIKSESLFILTLIGVFFRMLSQILGFVFVAKAKIKIVIGVEGFYNILLVALSIYMIKINGLNGAIEAFLISNIIYFVGIYFIFYLKFIKKTHV